MITTEKADKFLNIVTMERDVHDARVLVGFGYDYATKERNAKRLDFLTDLLYGMIDDLSLDELHELAEYRRIHVIGGIIGGTVI